MIDIPDPTDMSLEEFVGHWCKGTWPVWQEVRWLASAGIPAMMPSHLRRKAMVLARERLSLSPDALEAHIVYYTLLEAKAQLSNEQEVTHE